MTRRTAAGLSIALLLVIYLAVNVLAGILFRSAELDLTANRLYTLSGGTKSMLGKLEEPVTLRLYFSERLSADYQSVSAYGVRLRNLLREFAKHSKGKLLVDFVDPEPFGPDEEMAEAYGLSSAETPAGEKIFLGLVGTNVVDGMETIPFFAPDREVYLEYDVASLIHNLSAPKKSKLGLITSLPMEMGPGGYLALLQGGQASPYVVYEQLRQSFDIETLGEDVRVIPDDVDVLMIAHAAALKPVALYAIDQFALRGGRLLVFVDPLSEASAQGGMGGGAGQQSDLAPLLAKWGVAYDPVQIVLDKSRALEVQYGRGAQAAVVPYVAWLRLKDDDINRTDLVTADVETVQLASAGALSHNGDAKTSFEPLLMTSGETQLLPAMMMQVAGDPRSLLQGFKSDGTKRVIAARVTGPIESAYPDGPPPPEPDEAGEEGETGEPPLPEEPEEPLPAHIQSGMAPLNLIVVADADMLEDQFWVQTQDFLGQRVAQPTAGNGFFVVNAVDQLMGSEDLISLRSRAPSDRPFTVVQAIERSAQEKYRTEEERLQQEVSDTEARLAELQGPPKEEGDTLVEPMTESVLTPEQTKEIRRFQAQLVETRRALREVQRELRADVNRLGTIIKFLNIALVPIIVAALAIVLAILRRRRRAAARLAASGHLS